MLKKTELLMSFRARLMMLLTAFLLLTIFLVFALDKWAQKKVDQQVQAQNQQVKDAVSEGYGDFALAVGAAVASLDSDTFLYEQLKSKEISLPPSIAHIIITDNEGLIKDATVRVLVGHYIQVPPAPEATSSQGQIGDPVEKEVEIEPSQGLTKTYDLPVTTNKGLHWIVIVQNQQGVLNQVESASNTLARENRALSNYRLAATSGVLLLALGIAVFIGWRFTKPVNELARAARRVAEGDLDFQVGINRQDEVGQLATTFNEMIAGLKSKRDLEERLNHAERAAAIGRLTQAVAHEIRNPLNVLNLSIDHVSARFGPEDSGRRNQFTSILNSIKDEIQRLNRLVSDLLNYGRPAKLTVQSIDLRSLINETVKLVRPQADDQGIEISVDQESEPVVISGDAERLKSCLSNLAINAIQAMPQGGRLSTHLQRTNGTVEVSIADTGIGIGPEALGKIFEPYFSTKQTGFGLGLAVTKKIIEEHNGTVEVESEPGRGTTFTVKLPAAPGQGAVTSSNGDTRDGKEQNTGR